MVEIIIEYYKIGWTDSSGKDMAVIDNKQYEFDQACRIASDACLSCDVGETYIINYNGFITARFYSDPDWQY